MRVSLEQLQHVCNEIKNKNEITIIEKYGRIGKHQTIIITSKYIHIYIYIYIYIYIFIFLLIINILIINKSEKFIKFK